MDTLFSVFVIGSLVVIAWRGLWGIMDLTLYPDDKAKSAWGSLVSDFKFPATFLNTQKLFIFTDYRLHNRIFYIYFTSSSALDM